MSSHLLFVLASLSLMSMGPRKKGSETNVHELVSSAGFFLGNA